ncbi:MAG: hypothetical protein JEZ06_24930 [Anaerolineaceae bacterium]|nr:hypothetical protein [Anaerolineaceae bacterium]
MLKENFYQIRIKGHISDSWSTWFEGLTIQRENDGETILTGELADQTALHGTLNKLRDLGLKLIEVKTIKHPNDDLDHQI